MQDDQVRFFKALGDPTRLSIVGHLMMNEHCACDFQGMNKKDQTTISRHLKILDNAGIVKRVKEGRNVKYSIKDDAMRDTLIRMGVLPVEDCVCCRPLPSNEGIKLMVQDAYGKIASEGGSCGCNCSCGDNFDPKEASVLLGYSEDDLEKLAAANLGLGCGNPGAMGEIEEGMTVLDLGSGAGLDSFLAALKVGPQGKVIGVDITTEMVQKARRNAQELGFSHVEFHEGDIEDLPIPDASVDVVLSNCVINLAPDKGKVFKEVCRVLRPGGRAYISDMVLTEEITTEQRANKELITGCVGGAILHQDYLRLIEESGLNLLNEGVTEGVGERQYPELPVLSVKIVAGKP
ncbi:MAG: arsenite methyltransferase [Candidatus Methanomethylophilaceae archaeon]|nr:arsenite methyltransferase [Candidatus Methanomethylophilaceae archaeon]